MLPRHVGIIPDGNRRWARARGLPPWEGHRQGVRRFEEILNRAHELGIKVVTFYGFSLKNFQRSEAEKKAIFYIMERELPRLGKIAEERNLRLIFPGRLELFPDKLSRKLVELQESFSTGEKTLIILLGYDGEDEIKRAALRFAEAVKRGEQADFEDFLDIPKDIPRMDLIIRTSGEQRVSGFPLLHVSYAELYFSPKFWPDFTSQDFEGAVQDFSRRERRFGR